MNYMGSKKRIAKYILPLMLKKRTPNQFWIEPFVGGGNMIERVNNPRIGGDNNKYCIEALKAIRDSAEFLPKNNKEFTESDYRNLAYSDFKYKGFAYFTYSYGGKFKGGWARNKANRDYVTKAYNSAIKQSLKLKGVILKNASYQELFLPPNSLIYCDLPYQDTTKYRINFNPIDFWEWCRDKVKEGHTIFISEYEAPADFNCIWEKEIITDLKPNTGNKKGIEKLFTLR